MNKRERLRDRVPIFGACAFLVPRRKGSWYLGGLSHYPCADCRALSEFWPSLTESERLCFYSTGESKLVSSPKHNTFSAGKLPSKLISIFWLVVICYRPYKKPAQMASRSKVNFVPTLTPTSSSQICNNYVAVLKFQKQCFTSQRNLVHFLLFINAERQFVKAQSSNWIANKF